MVVASRLVVRPALKQIARWGGQEVFTAAALLVVPLFHVLWLMLLWLRQKPKRDEMELKLPKKQLQALYERWAKQYPKRAAYRWALGFLTHDPARADVARNRCTGLVVALGPAHGRDAVPSPAMERLEKESHAFSNLASAQDAAMH